LRSDRLVGLAFNRRFQPRSVEDFATVGMALTLSADHGTCRDIRLGLNSVIGICFWEPDANN